MSEFYKKHKLVVFVFIAFVLVTAISGYFAFSDAENEVSKLPINTKSEDVNYNTEQDLQLESEEDSRASMETQDLPNSQVEKKEVKDLKIEILPVKTEAVGTKLIVGEKTYTLDFEGEKTVQEVMNLMQDSTDFSFTTRDYGKTLGEMVTEINGVKNNPKSNKYWIYSVDGEKAKVGISNNLITKNNLIEWTYEDSEY